MSERTVDDHRCFCCGKDNPRGLHLSFAHPEDGRAETEMRIPEYFSGWQEIAHGGFLAMILDESVRARAEIAQARAKLLETRGVITDAAGVELARATGRFVKV